jgi:hypothetical protein
MGGKEGLIYWGGDDGESGVRWKMNEDSGALPRLSMSFTH